MLFFRHDIVNANNPIAAVVAAVGLPTANQGSGRGSWPWSSLLNYWQLTD